MSKFQLFAALFLSLMLAAPVHAQENKTATADDTARFLAGMSVSADSPLAPIAQDPFVKQLAASFEAAFDKVEKAQLSKVRAWSATNLTAPKPVMFYMFGGPDFLYANAFFPNANTYVLSGLEPVGPIPDVLKLPRGTVAPALRSVQGAMRNILTVSYFITANMSYDLNAGPLNGTLPILYVFLARSGKKIHDVSPVHLNELGELQSGDGLRPLAPARGIKIIFSENNGPQKTLYYFSTNLEDVRGRNIALLQFCKSLGTGDSFVKSASYLLHNSNFSQVRNFLLDNSDLILQDDTGVPVAYFNPVKWRLRPHGRYVSPIPIFAGMYQPRLNELFQKNPPAPIDFGVGYRWYPNESNLMLAIKDPNAPDVPTPVAASVAAQPVPTQAPAIARVPANPAIPPIANDPAFTNLAPVTVSERTVDGAPGLDPNGPIRQAQQCWVSTDRDRGFGYFGPC